MVPVPLDLEMVPVQCGGGSCPGRPWRGSLCGGGLRYVESSCARHIWSFSGGAFGAAVGADGQSLGVVLEGAWTPGAGLSRR